MADKQAGQHHVAAGADSRRVRLIAALLIGALSTTVLLLREGQRAPVWLQRRLDLRANPERSGPRWGPWGIPDPTAAPRGDGSGGAADGVPAAAAAASNLTARSGGVHLRNGVQHIEQPAVALWEAGAPFTAPHSGCTVHPDGESLGVGQPSCHRASRSACSRALRDQLLPSLQPPDAGPGTQQQQPAAPTHPTACRPAPCRPCRQRGLRPLARARQRPALSL